MKRREAKGLTAGLALLALVCAPAGAAAQTFEQPTLAPPVMAPPPVVMPGAPSAPPIALDRSDRRFLDELSKEIDRMIAEVNERRALMMETFSGREAERTIAKTFSDENAQLEFSWFEAPTYRIDGLVFVVRSIDYDLLYQREVPEDVRENFVAPRTMRSTNFSSRAAESNSEFLETVKKRFYDNYADNLIQAKDGLAARGAVIAQQSGQRASSLTTAIRNGLKADLKYLQGGHDLWKSAEADLTTGLLPDYQGRILHVHARLAMHNQKAIAILNRWDAEMRQPWSRYIDNFERIVDLDEEMERVGQEPGRMYTSDESYAIALKQKSLFEEQNRLREENKEIKQRESEIQSSEILSGHLNCAYSLGVWVNELVARTKVSPPVSIYYPPQHAVTHLGGRPYFRPYETDALAPDLLKHLEKEDPCGAAPPPEEVPARLSIVIPRFDAPPPPDLLDDDDFAAPMPTLVFEPANEVHYGHPFHVEALFEEDRPGSTYSVRLNGQHSVVVEQTEENPRLYRSVTLVLTYRGLIHGGGR